MADRARVLVLAPSGELNGGAQFQYRYLIDGLRRSRYEPLVVTPAAGSFRDDLVAAGIQTWVLPHPAWSRGEVLRWRHALWIERRRAHDRLMAFARAQTPQIVHGDAAVAPYLAALSRALDVPAVVHVRGALTPRAVRRLRLARASALIAIGDGYRDELLRRGLPAARVAAIADATDLRRFRPRPCAVLRRDDPSIAADDVLFGIVGRIEPFKRQLDFLRAAADVRAAGRRARFFVIGADNPHRPGYARRVRAFAAAHGLDRRVTLTGHRHDIADVIASLDVLVTLSGGSVMLEAMASAVPVITASARPPDTLRIVRDGESGRVVPARDRDALVRAMVELCDDADLRCRLGEQGRRRAEACFGRDRLVDETMRLYDALLAPARRQRPPVSSR